MSQQSNKPKRPYNKPFSLHGLQFQEAVAALLKVKPEKKTPKKKRSKKS